MKRQHTEFENIVVLIQEARNRAFSKVNAELVLLYYSVGKIVSEKVAAGAWGEGTVDQLAKYIAAKLPGLSGFNRRGLYRMKQFFETYSIEQFVSPVATHLRSYLTNNSAPSKMSETTVQLPNERLNLRKDPQHYHMLMILNYCIIRLFYILLSIKEKLSVREIERQLNTAVYERSMLGKQFVSTALTQLPEGLFRDPYIFEFLDLPNGHSEKDLEKALMLNLKKFILEVGKGFTYMGNQYRLQVGNKDYCTDLLFYHRDLQCLVLFELKIQEFEPEFLGKLNFYLEALDRDVKRPFENNSVGVLLCKGKDSEVVEYAMARNTSLAMIADYETKLIPKNVLANKLHQLVKQLSKKGDK